MKAIFPFTFKLLAATCSQLIENASVNLLLNMPNIFAFENLCG